MEVAGAHSVNIFIIFFTVWKLLSQKPAWQKGHLLLMTWYLGFGDKFQEKTPRNERFLQRKRVSITPFFSANYRNWYQQESGGKKSCLLTGKKKKKGGGGPQGTENYWIMLGMKCQTPSTHTLRATHPLPAEAKKTKPKNTKTKKQFKKRADGEHVEFLAWVSSLQQLKLMHFNVLARVGSAPLSSWVWGGPACSLAGLKRKTSEKQLKGTKNQKEQPRGFRKGKERKKTFLLQASQKPVQQKEQCSIPGPRCPEHTREIEQNCPWGSWVPTLPWSS